MTYYDVFNGDADGICALQQLRLSDPRESVLITGVKRDIQLLERVYAQDGDEITVLDISMDRNRKGLESVLKKEVTVEYFDHHFAGDMVVHPRLKNHIDTSPETCTSLLVDEFLQGKQKMWAVAGAFGDSMDASARRAAEPLKLSDEQLSALRELGILINYNAYGIDLDDLYFAPQELFKKLHPYASPLDFIHDDESFRRLRDGYADDMAKAEGLSAELQNDTHALYILPSEHWANRVSGVFGNHLASSAPHRAHALLTRLEKGGYRVSVRAPESKKTGADELCRHFPTGGGRKAAAGINHLPDDLYGEFITYFQKAFK
jgi:hypothetical protein